MVTINMYNYLLTGNCLRLEGTGDLNHLRCVERFVSGCPTEPYADDEIYKCTFSSFSKSFKKYIFLEYNYEI